MARANPQIHKTTPYSRVVQDELRKGCARTGGPAQWLRPRESPIRGRIKGAGVLATLAFYRATTHAGRVAHCRAKNSEASSAARDCSSRPTMVKVGTRRSPRVSGAKSG